MSHHWDEFSKSLAQPLPRRESLRRLGVALAGAVLSPLGLRAASPGHHPKQQADACKTFCKCRNHKQQDQCLKACNACGKSTSRLGGSCGNYFCCAAAQTSCGNYCADLGNDPYNCGACGYACEEPGPHEYGACINGTCEYACVEGAVYCDGACTFLGWDPNNCGGCRNVCPASAPYCNQGGCSACPPGTALCGGQCVDLLSDSFNCGACGNVCDESTHCSQGACNPSCTFPFILCGGVCVDPTSDRFNCGGCGVQCADSEACINSFCESY